MCVRGAGVNGVVSRRLIGAAAVSAPGDGWSADAATVEPGAVLLSAVTVSTIGALLGTRSSSNRSMARTIGSAWKRCVMTSACSVLFRATRLIPWWCAMYDRTTTERFPLGTRSGV